jgi:hypothetical protein
MYYSMYMNIDLVLPAVSVDIIPGIKGRLG